MHIFQLFATLVSCHDGGRQLSFSKAVQPLTPKLGMPFVAELQQGKLSSAVLSFSTVEVCSSDLTHMHVIVTKKNV